MADVVVSSDNLTVLGGPSSVSVDIDFGPQGDRGSYILVGSGQPNDPNTVIGETPQVYDMYINVLSSDSEYMYIYQYLNVGIELTWVKLMKLTPNVYSLNSESVFSSGSTTINIPLTTIIPSYPELLASITAESFNIQCNIINQNPLAMGMTVSDIVIDPITSDQILQLTISASELDSGNWIDLVGTKIVHLYITVV